MNLDDVTLEELEEFVNKYAQDKHSLGRELFPDKHPGYMRDLNFLERYAKEKIEAMRDRLAGRIERALKHEENCEKYYRSLSDEAKW